MLTVRSAAPAPLPPLPGGPGRAPPGQGCARERRTDLGRLPGSLLCWEGGRRGPREGGERAGAGPYYDGAQMWRVLKI